jgi:hypothetical protein
MESDEDMRLAKMVVRNMIKNEIIPKHSMHKNYVRNWNCALDIVKIIKNSLRG